ncbi:hypothetical protein M885DRAFT_527460 [Pelagophyceae sp. CCMP2097]|nr:hypothetical protein M885DRAFT_527460 [Pelagophyceae sp. CCMP2097]
MSQSAPTTMQPSAEAASTAASNSLADVEASDAAASVLFASCRAPSDASCCCRSSDHNNNLKHTLPNPLADASRSRSRPKSARRGGRGAAGEPRERIEATLAGESSTTTVAAGPKNSTKAAASAADREPACTVPRTCTRWSAVQASRPRSSAS